MTVALAAIIGLLLAGQDLELPHVVVKGSLQLAAPERTYWPVPELRSGPEVRVDLPAPRSQQTAGQAPASPIRRPPPAGFSITAGVGPHGSGRLVLGMGEVNGGVGADLWTFETGDMDRRGVRGLAVVSGRWGSASARIQHWADRVLDHEVAPGWAHGEATLTMPVAAGEVGGRVSGTGSDGEGFHGQAWFRGVSPGLGLPIDITAGDRVVGGHLACSISSPRVMVRAGPMLVDDGDSTQWTVEGSVRVGPFVMGSAAFAISAYRSLSLQDGAWLREVFPAAEARTTAQPEFVEWCAAATADVRASAHLLVSGSLEVMRLGHSPAWRAADSLHWRAESLSGEGIRGTGSLSWRDRSFWVVAGVRLEDLDVSLDDVEPQPRSSQWPLVPDLAWWVHAAGGTRPHIRLAVGGDTGRQGWDEELPSSTGVTLEAALPLRGGWETWIRASHGWGWGLSPQPRRMVSIGIGWSLKRPYGQEGIW